MMLPFEGSDILRVAVLSGALGFAGFCVSYGVYVWRRRNAAHRRHKPLPIRIARLLGLVGCATITLIWVFNEFRGRTGIAGGSDVFVVSARSELAGQQITSAETVEAGDIIAEFLTPADRARITGIDLQRSQAQAKKEAIASKVLQSDEALLQDQTHLRSELLQLKGFAFQLQNSRYESERERASLVMSWTREDSKLLEDIAVAESEHVAAVDRHEITRRALQRGQGLLKHGDFTRQELDVRGSDDIAAELAEAKSKQSVGALQARRGSLGARFAASVGSLDRQIAEAERDHDGITATITELEAKLGQVRRDLDADRDRAVVSRRREVEAVDYDISILAEEKKRLTEINQVRSPFSGRVIYRHPAPGLASHGAPVLVISAGTGFTANIRLPQSELAELEANGDAVTLALESPVLHQFITGRFVRAEPLPLEQDRVIAYFDCSLPPEIISQLGSSAAPTKVKLLWHPSLLHQTGFKLGLLLLGLGTLSFAGGIRKSAEPKPAVAGLPQANDAA